MSLCRLYCNWIRKLFYRQKNHFYGIEPRDSTIFGEIAKNSTIDSTNYYSILGVSSTASAKNIRAAYKRQCKRLHPDVNTDNDTTKKMQLLNEAYCVLRDSSLRYIYDKEHGLNKAAYQTQSQRSASRCSSIMYRSRFYETSSWSDDFEKREDKEPWFENTWFYFYFVEIPFYIIRDFVFLFVKNKDKKWKYKI